MQIRHYTRIIWHSLGLLLLVTCLAAGATYAISKFLLTPVYQASTLVQVNAAGDSSTVYQSQAQAITYALLVTTNTVLQAAANEVHGATLAQLQTEVSASPLAGTSIIEIRVQTNDARQAAAIANTVAQDFIHIQLTAVNNTLQDNLQKTSQLLDTAKTNLSTAQAQLTALQNAHASATSIARQAGVVSDAQLNYDSLLLNYQQEQQQQIRANHLLTWIQRANAPAAPLSPRTSVNTLVAAALALVLVIVFVLVRDWVDNTVKTPEDVARLARLEPLGGVPLAKRSLASPVLVGTGARSNSAFEHIFTLMGLSFLKKQEKRSVLLITALRPGAGTTTVAVNMAVVFAQMGKRVLLIDTNKSHPTLSRRFSHPDNKGLLDSLADVPRLHEEEAPAWLGQWSTGIPNLWVIPIGHGTSSPGATLRSPELRMLVRGLLGSKHVSSYNSRASEGIVDYIVFDTANLAESVDPIVLTSLTDQTVLVIEAGKEHGAALAEAGAAFQRLGSPLAGVVVNRQKTAHRPYFYSESYQPNPAPLESGPAASAGQTVIVKANQEGTKSVFQQDFPLEVGPVILHTAEESRSFSQTFPPSPLPPPVGPNWTREFDTPEQS